MPLTCMQLMLRKTPKSLALTIGNASIVGSNTQAKLLGFSPTFVQDGGQVAACKMIPQNIADEIRANMRQGGSSRSASNPPLFYEEVSTHASCMGGWGSAKAFVSDFVNGKRQQAKSHGHAQQVPLPQMLGNEGGSVAFL